MSVVVGSSGAPPMVPGSDPSAARQARLAEGVSGLRRRRATPTRKVEQYLMYSGGILLPLGLLLIVLGWQGAAHTPRLFEQIPYLISGGILGAGMVLAGGFLYFSYWLTRLVFEGRSHTDQLIEAINRLEATVAAGSAASGLAMAPLGVPAAWASDATLPGAPPFGSQIGLEGGGAMLVATATGTMVHRPGCVIVEGKTNLRPIAADADGFKACRICDPLALVDA